MVSQSPQWLSMSLSTVPPVGMAETFWQIQVPGDIRTMTGAEVAAVGNQGNKGGLAGLV